MATGMSIHVGVNDTEAPGITGPKLEGCDQDATDMFELARKRGFIGVGDGTDEPIIGNNATHDKVLGKIRIAANELKDGDIFLFTFSGHGTRRGQEDPKEVDLKDETLVMQDAFLVDNVLRRLLWPQFKPGVRVVMVSDSCHSGGAAMSSMVRDSEGGSSNGGGSSVVAAPSRRDWSAAATETVPQTRTLRGRPQGKVEIRTVSEIETENHFALLKEFYDKLRNELPPEAPSVPGRVLLLAACREDETTKDGNPNGVFTRELLEVFKANGPKTYKELMDGISVRLEAANESSHPLMMSIGESPPFSDTEAFRI